MKPRMSRLLSVIAAVILAFDGTALVVFGWWSGRVMLLLLGIICLASAGLVVLSWRWYRRRLEDIATLRQGLADEARELQSFLREK
jgi:membrane protein implicated in regulation of membrane protease activity